MLKQRTKLDKAALLLVVLVGVGWILAQDITVVLVVGGQPLSSSAVTEGRE